MAKSRYSYIPPSIKINNSKLALKTSMEQESANMGTSQYQRTLFGPIKKVDDEDQRVVESAPMTIPGQGSY